MNERRNACIKALQQARNSEKAAALQRFFKTGKGEYGEGDTFLGITVPQQRKIAHSFLDLTFPDISYLLQQPIHEYRFTALEILVAQYERGDEKMKKQVFDFYRKNILYINNWDLVDTSCVYIVGNYLKHKPKTYLYTLARSKNMWKRRIAIVSTAAFIANNSFSDTLAIAELLLTDSHDLIHKAVGWMLREVGKRSLKTEEQFLKKYAKVMPRTMLRYAIERFPKEARMHYMAR